MEHRKRKAVIAVAALSLLFLGFIAGVAADDFFIAGDRYEIVTSGKQHIAAGNADGKINPNTASAAELMDLPGIGTAMADRIIASREEYGDFQSAEDLLRVSGIGEKTLDKLRDYLSFEE